MKGDVIINLKEDWHKPLAKAAGGPTNQMISKEERPNGGNTYSVNMNPNIDGDFAIKRIIFLTFHKSDFSRRLRSPDGHGTDIYRFINTSQDVFYLSYQPDWGYKEPIHHTTGILKPLEWGVNALSRKAKAHAIILSVVQDRQFQEYQIGDDGKPTKFKKVPSGMGTKEIFSKSSFGSKAIDNRDISHLVETWYPEVKGKKYHHKTSIAGSAAGQIVNLGNHIIS